MLNCNSIGVSIVRKRRKRFEKSVRDENLHDKRAWFAVLFLLLLFVQNFRQKKIGKKEREGIVFPFLLSLGMDTKFEITKFEITKFDITKFDITKFDITKFDITKFDITKFDITKFEITKI